MPPVVLKALLGPVLLVQGFWVRWRTPILAEPDGSRQGQAGAGPPLRLLVLGDSAAAGVGVASQSEALLGVLTGELAQFYTVTYQLVAETGATTADALDTLAAMDRTPHDVVVTSLGVNDLTSARPIKVWLADQERLIEDLQDRFNPRVILISGLPPMHRFPALPQPLRWYLGRGARAFSAVLEVLAGAHEALFLPLDFSLDRSQMATDGFHPGRGIYREWGHRAAKRIRKRLAAAAAGEPGRLRPEDSFDPAGMKIAPMEANPNSAPVEHQHPALEKKPCPDC